jgi:hypothetical protein
MRQSLTPSCVTFFGFIYNLWFQLIHIYIYIYIYIYIVIQKVIIQKNIISVPFQEIT